MSEIRYKNLFGHYCLWKYDDVAELNSYNTYKGTPISVTIPTGSIKTIITNPVNIPQGVYFARLETGINALLNYFIQDNSNYNISVGSVGGGEFCSVFKITSEKTLRGAAENWGTSTKTMSDDASWFGLFLVRLGG